MNHSHNAVEAFIPFVLLLLMASFVVGLIWLRMSVHKSTIRDAVKNLGATPLRIQWWPTLWSHCDTHYNVTMHFPGQPPCSVLCQCSLWRGVYWKDTPWLARPYSSPPITASTSTCKSCGYALQSEWRCCPKCSHPFQ